MKMNIVGLLRQAKRHLEILEQLANTHPEIIESDVQSKFEVISTSMILGELIQNIEIVQSDPDQLEAFLRGYCLKKD